MLMDGWFTTMAVLWAIPGFYRAPRSEMTYWLASFVTIWGLVQLIPEQTRGEDFEYVTYMCSLYCTGSDFETPLDEVLSRITASAKNMSCARDCAISRGVHVESTVVRVYLASLFGMVVASLTTGQHRTAAYARCILLSVTILGLVQYNGFYSRMYVDAYDWDFSQRVRDEFAQIFFGRQGSAPPIRHLSQLFHLFDYVLIVLTSVINYLILLIRLNKYVQVLYSTGLHRTFIIAVFLRRIPLRLSQRYSPNSSSITSKNLMVSLFLEDRASRLADP